MGKNEEHHGYLDALASRLRLPFTVPEFIDRVVSGGTDQIGRHMLAALITTWDQAGGGPFAATTVSGLGATRAVDTVMEFFLGGLIERLLEQIGGEELRLRAGLCASQLVGIGIMRYASKTEPLASMDVQSLVDLLAPTLQRYLVGELH